MRGIFILVFLLLAASLHAQVDASNSESAVLKDVRLHLEKHGYLESLIEKFNPSKPLKASRSETQRLIGYRKNSISDSNLIRFSDSSELLYNGNKGSVFMDNIDCHTQIMYKADLNNKVAPHTTVYNTHDTIGRLAERETLRWQQGAWVPIAKLIKGYSGWLDIATIFVFDNGVWIPQRQVIVSNDTTTKVIYTYQAIYKNGNWEPQYKEQFRSSIQNDKLVEYHYMQWLNSKWDTTQHAQFSYDTSNKLVLLSERFMNSSFVYYYVKTAYQYDTNSIYIGFTSQMNDQGFWMNYSKEERVLNQLGKSIEIKSFLPFGINGWTLTKQVLLSYNSNGKADTITFFIQDAQSPFNPMKVDYREIYDYNTDSLTESFILQQGNSLNNIYRATYVYSSSGMIEEFNEFNWVAGNWNLLGDNQYTYNSHDLLTYYKNYNRNVPPYSGYEEYFYYEDVSINSVAVKDDADMNLHVYPNPTSSSINIDLSTPSGNEYVEVFDLVGRKLLHTKCSEPSTTIILDELQTGAYLICLSNSERILKVKRIVKN